MSGFETRGNHGKCYSQWTLPSALWINATAAEELENALQRLGNILREEATKDAPHRDAEKESMMAAPIAPPYVRYSTIFNAVVEEPRLLAREAEWLTSSRRHIKRAEEVEFVLQHLLSLQFGEFLH